MTYSKWQKIHKNKVRNSVRALNKAIRADDYHKDVIQYFELTIVRWNPKSDAVLVRCGDKRVDERFRSYKWIHGWSQFYRWELWSMANDTMCKLHNPKVFEK